MLLGRREDMFGWLVGGVGVGAFVGLPPSSLNPALLRVGDQVGGAYVAGTYTYGGQAVTLAAPVYTVNGNTVAANYVLQVGDLVAAAAIAASVGGSPVGTVYAEPTDVTDFSYTTSDFEFLVIAGAGDTTPPVLSNPAAAANGATAIDATVDTINDANGTLYIVAYDSSHAAPTAANVKAGNDGAGAALKAQSQAVTATGTQIVALTGVSGAAAYKVAFAHEDAYGNLSSVSIISGTVTLITVPAQMAAPALSSTATRITVTKAADPANGGSPITSYDFQYSTNGGSSWTVVAGFTSPQAQPGFTPGAAGMLVQERAVNIVGPGPWSASASIDMKLPVLRGQKIFSPTRNSTDNTISLTDMTGGTGQTAPAAGNFLAIAYGTGSIANRAIGVVAGQGWTDFIAKIYQNNTEDLNFAAAYKVMGSTPDTQVIVTGTLNSADAGAIVIQCWDFVDPVNPIDTASPSNVVATSGSGGQPVFGAITPTTTKARILCMGGGAGVTCVDFTTTDLSNFLPFTGNGTHDAAVAIGSVEWAGGAFTAANWGGGEAGAGNARAAVVAALRPY